MELWFYQSLVVHINQQNEYISNFLNARTFFTDLYWILLPVNGFGWFAAEFAHLTVTSEVSR